MTGACRQSAPSAVLSVAAKERSVLIVDDDPIQLKLMRRHLIDAGFTVRTASCAASALESARAERPDAIVSDVRMSELDGFMLCSLIRADDQLAALPIMLVTATFEGEDDRRLAMAAGAETLIERSPGFENELETLIDLLGIGGSSDVKRAPRPDASVLRMASKVDQLLTQSHAAEARYRTLLESANDAIALLTPEGIILEINRGCEKVLQRSRGAMIGHHIREFAPPGQEDATMELYRHTIDGAGGMAALPVARPDGTHVYVEWSNKAVRFGDETVVLAVGRDVTESVLARRAVAASEKKYRSLIESIPDVVWSATLEGAITFISPRVEGVCGFTAEELTAAAPSFWFDRIHTQDVDQVRQAYASVSKTDFSAEYRWRHKNGQWIWLRSHATARLTAEGTTIAEGTFADITELKRVQEHLAQSQKMEAVGQLTGGIAHDFNNILAVIMGNGEFLREALQQGDPRRGDADQIIQAGQRAAALTRQLLAFSRRQMLEPRVLDLNQVVRGLETMLHRVIGEDIELSCSLAEGLHSVRADAGQIEQVIMNLIVNARDAMPLGGRLSIETSNVRLEDQHGIRIPGSPKGDYVMLAVSDTGCGMDAETQRRVFEPFFTTKEVGKGTGLGLSTCYGIVKQSEGYLLVQSEPGHGAVFKVFLPVARGEARGSDSAALPPTAATGTETILLIEDDQHVRATVRRILGKLGYRILEARDAEEAIAAAELHAATIDLLLSDVVMPRLNGPEIVNRVRNTAGRARTLFMSGYTDHAALRDGILTAGVNFIQKPFAPAALAQKVRDVLDALQVA